MNIGHFQSSNLSIIIRKRWFMLLVMTFLLVLNLPVILGSEISRPLMIDLTAITGAVVTVVIFFLNTSLNYLRNRHTGGFLAFTVGVFFWLAAEASWAYYREGLGVEVPYPSIADLFWLIGYGFFFIHNYRLLSKLREATHIDRNMIILVSVAVGVTLGYILNLTFGVAEILSSSTDSLSFGVSVFYPIIDGIILIPSMIIFWSLRKGDPSYLHWLLMSASFVMVTIGDIGFGYSFALSPDVAGEYEWIWSIFFNTCYVCMSAGGIWFYLVSRRNNIKNNLTKKAMS
jgi:hypothetical protein